MQYISFLLSISELYMLLDVRNHITFADIYCLQKKREKKAKITYRACAHYTLVALLRWEEVVLVEGLPWLINSSIIPAGFH